MKNYQFYDNATGEIFFVQENTLTDAKTIAEEYFEEPEYCGRYFDDYTAEQLGYDTYQCHIFFILSTL